jgi:hypothetical protein
MPDLPDIYTWYSLNRTAGQKWYISTEIAKFMNKNGKEMRKI